MALDGAFLRHIKKELEGKLLGARVDKIHQPNREELVVAFRSREGAEKVLFSARANSARVHLSKMALENPKQPPMLCMLLRKKLQGAKLTAIHQPELERLLHFDFDTVNELGDHVTLTLTIEIMGRYSNIILIGPDGKVIDALKRVDAEMSSQRLVLPGLTYQLPPPQDKLCMLTATSAMLIAALKALPRDMELSKGLLGVLQGVSPVVCREIAHRVGRGQELTVKTMDEEQYFRLGFFYQKWRETVTEISGQPYMAVNMQKKPIDFSFTDIQQYGTSAVIRQGGSFSQMLDEFYWERDTLERMRVREQDLLRLLSTHSERLARKINAQKAELEQCGQRENLRIAGDLLSANLYSLNKGNDSVELVNFYEETQPLVKIKLDPSLTPNQNAQKYYKEYRKAKTAEEKLTEQIDLAGRDLIYLDSVLDALARAETERDLAEIRTELKEQGYIRVNRNKKEKATVVSEPLRFTVSDNFTVLVGRNNRQNDRLTLKTANNNDLWFHTKNIPGAHTVLVTEGRNPSAAAMEDAAKLAAKHSKAKDSAQVPVDYTQIRHVSKPQGGRPGMVIYVNQKTIFVNPTE
ncbi:Rqc2 family fibronectin-binding protein [Acutalibacter caecimuris]|uniref:Rqc2 family fibronectin-binding protein n=1 Tax=Acutalibacter caecimuris TaxID=3093657 RepID=UPI002AC8B349|nr:NFACT RNA binding domain-containing protein [Acutalibacter sp. M00118]